MISALERRCREGSFAAAERNRALEALQQDLSRLIVVEATADVSSLAAIVLSQHPLRAGDAVQLASALELHEKLRYPLTFVAFDQRLLGAAAARGLPICPEAS